MRIALAVLLLTLGACGKKPAEAPQPKPREIAKPVADLPNYRRGLKLMRGMRHTPASMRRARVAMPNLIAKAEARFIDNAEAQATCVAWDSVAANAIRQNDAAKVHIWGLLADRRCGRFGHETRYWRSP